MNDITNSGPERAVESAVGRSLAGKYLTFRLDREEYGLEILKVREIIGLMGITKVPRTPHYIRGVINLRGKVIPVLDLRAKFGMDVIADTEETCIIVVDVQNTGNSIMMGILVDAVSEVLDIQAGEIEEPPTFGSEVDTRFILGIGKVKNSVKILLDIDRVLTGVDFSAAEGMEAAVESVTDAELTASLQ
ncbi:MAG: purine-binding chemotaxis protein CheW [candidate division Zixibacteria bacterium]|nr:purine-binding chemotaxis protein CheW [candidate division Zixibacteria bacterium]